MNNTSNCQILRARKILDKRQDFDFENTFNAEEYLYFYHDNLSEDRTKREIDFLIKFAKLEHPIKILDLACGHGRHSNYLAKLGHTVTGIDYSQDFLETAKKEALKHCLEVDYIKGDMRTIAYNNAFDRVFVLFTAIGYFDDGQNLKVFKNIYKAIKPGGIFCFDSHNRDTFLSYYKPRSVIEKDNNSLIDQVKFDSKTGRCQTKRTIHYKQSTKSFTYTVRFYSPSELQTLLSSIGFTTIKFYEDWSGTPLTPASKKIITLATK